MTGSEGPRAVIVLVAGDRRILLGTISPATRCDLGLVDDILRLRLAVTRFGWSLRLLHVADHLRELISLVGLDDCLETDETDDYSSMRGGRPNSANSSG